MGSVGLLGLRIHIQVNVIKTKKDPDLLVGYDKSDDAGVYRVMFIKELEVT